MTELETRYFGLALATVDHQAKRVTLTPAPVAPGVGEEHRMTPADRQKTYRWSILSAYDHYPGYLIDPAALAAEVGT